MATEQPIFHVLSQTGEYPGERARLRAFKSRFREARRVTLEWMVDALLADR